MATIALVGTCDTKLRELLFLRQEILSDKRCEKVVLIAAGREVVHDEAISISLEDLASGSGEKIGDLKQLSRAEVISHNSRWATKAVKELHESSSIHGVVAAGGSGNTSIAAAVMRDALPIGFPKLIVSTIASGDTGPIVGETDITLMYSVVDISGLNGLLRGILSNAAAMIVGAADLYNNRVKATPDRDEKKARVGITMFGVTTPGVDAIRAHLEANYNVETLIFHATGHGGEALERFIRQGGVDAVIDLTTTEICDHVTGGVMSAGPSRLDAAIEAGIPNLISLGALDMTNFGARETVPAKYEDRKLYVHNPVVTLMRTSPAESELAARFIADKVKRSSNPDKVQVWLPLGGISILAKPGGPFEDKEADEVLFKTLRNELRETGIKVVEDERDINHEGFAKNIAEELMKLVNSQ